MTADLIYFNGINGATGDYGLEPMGADALAKIAIGEPPPSDLKELEARKQRDDASPEKIERLKRKIAERELSLAAGPQPADGQAVAELAKLKRQLAQRQHLGVKEGVDATQLSQAGWGIIFPKDANPEIKAALQPLLDLRAAQAGERFRVYDYLKGETKSQFLKRNGASPSGPADPDKVPYYLLIVASPTAIPYTFQSQLDVQYAVGRLSFPNPAEYENYARNVVDVETNGIARDKRLALFSVRNPNDKATDLSSRLLIPPLHDALSGNELGWQTQQVAGEQATRARLGDLLGGSETPALLFTASHGMVFPLGDARQLPHQGALLCSDWPSGDAVRGKRVPEEFYFAGDHLASDANLQGTMLFCFACYAAGTPQREAFEERKQIAPHPFVSALPTRLLGHPRGALAVVGHVDRAWPCSFTGTSPQDGSYIGTFESALKRIMKGLPAGYALDYFNERYAELSTVLSERLDEIELSRQYDSREIAQMWAENNDAKGYVLLGDPAARLAFDGGAAKPVSRPSTASVSIAAADGDAIARPEEISEADWRSTPESVQRLVARLRGSTDQR